MKKWLIPLLVFTLVFSTSLTAFAVTANYNGVNHLELPNGQRIMTESSLKWGTYNLYIMPINNGIRICYPQYKNPYIVSSDGSYDSFYGSSSGTLTIGGTSLGYKEFKFPFTLGGTTFKDLSSFENQCKGDTVLRIYESSTSLDEATYFFKNPLLEEVKFQTEGANRVGSILVSYLHYLIPLGVSLLVLLISVPVFLRALRTFLR